MESLPDDVRLTLPGGRDPPDAGIHALRRTIKSRKLCGAQKLFKLVIAIRGKHRGITQGFLNFLETPAT
jgi:hypothetical protein